MQASSGFVSSVLVLLVSCQMPNPAFDPADGGDSLVSESGSNGESQTGSAGDGDPTVGDGDGDSTTAGDGDGGPNTSGDGDGEPGTSGDGDGEPGTCGDGNVDPGEECDDGNALDNDGCASDCTMENPEMIMCDTVQPPTTCAECVNLNCCTPGALECLDNNACLCVVGCIINNGEPVGCNQTCMADPPVVADVALQCIVTHCAGLCAG